MSTSSSKRELVNLGKQELALRELARREFAHFAPYVYRGYPQARHLAVLAGYLQQVERYIATDGRDGIGRLMINMPPRYWKSTTTSVLFPAWVLGRNPDTRMIVSSYNGSLATGFSKRIRDTISDMSYGFIFGAQSGLDPSKIVALASDSRSVEAWDMDGHRGGMAAAGVGGGLTGKGANLFIIDDPHKDRADAESAASRNRVWDWYTSTAYTRLEDNGAMIVIQTRWHADDLSGKLLKAMVTEADADKWVVVSMPALAVAYDDDDDKRLKSLARGVWSGFDPLGRKPGEPLWRKKHTETGLAIVKANVGGYEFSSLYQQTPQDRVGALIQAHKIKRISADKVPSDLDIVRYWDIAVSGSKRADWLCGAKIGYSRDGRLYILHLARFRGPWSTARGKITRQMLRDGSAIRQGIEVSGQQGGYYQEMKIDPDLLNLMIEPIDPKKVGNKIVRAGGWSSRIPDGLVYIVDDGSFDVDAFISEAVMFPNGAHDDQVDGVSGGVQMLGGWAGNLADVPQDESTSSPWQVAGDMTPFGEIEGWLQ